LQRYIYILVECCFSEHYRYPTDRVGLLLRGHRHQDRTCSLHDTAEKLVTLALNNTYSLIIEEYGNPVIWVVGLNFQVN
jgi:hypothetical protein